METIISLIEKQKTGDVQATQEICRRMTPLLKNMLPNFTVWNMMMPCRNYTLHYWKPFYVLG